MSQPPCPQRNKLVNSHPRNPALDIVANKGNSPPPGCFACSVFGVDLYLKRTKVELK